MCGRARARWFSWTGSINSDESLHCWRPCSAHLHFLPPRACPPASSTSLHHQLSLRPPPYLQVAFGLLQFMLSLSGETDGVNAPIGLNQLLQQYGLPLNPHKRAMHRRMDAEPQLFVARPLDAQALEYAGVAGGGRCWAARLHRMLGCCRHLCAS